jgi:oligopeptide/dipeptide ABC transporter ATP-binding protein
VAYPCAEESALLEVSRLHTVYPTARGMVQAVRNVSFAVSRGEIVGIVGESGCGKSALLLSIMGLLPSPGRIVQGQILFDGKNLVDLPEPAMRSVRGREIAMVFQDPMTALNPAHRVGEQIAESLRVHGVVPESSQGDGSQGRGIVGLIRRRLRRRTLSAAEEREYVIELMSRVGIPLPEHRHLEYPHQFSGGMQQRIMIAIALACRPKLLLADEPTTALDVTIQAQVLDLIEKINESTGTAVILVTHDLAVAADFCDSVAVMYAGQIVERGPTEAVMEDSAHPYTRGLLRSMPVLGERKPLRPIMGEVPDLANLGPGCSFAPRCDLSEEICFEKAPDVSMVAQGHEVRCHLHSSGGGSFHAKRPR